MLGPVLEGCLAQNYQRWSVPRTRLLVTQDAGQQVPKHQSLSSLSQSHFISKDATTPELGQLRVAWQRSLKLLLAEIQKPQNYTSSRVSVEGCRAHESNLQHTGLASSTPDRFADIWFLPSRDKGLFVQSRPVQDESSTILAPLAPLIAGHALNLICLASHLLQSKHSSVAWPSPKPIV